MKKEKYWKYFKKEVPEYEWEAKYLVANNNLMINLFGIMFFVVAFSLISLVIVTIISSCEVEIDGTIEGNFEFNTQNIEEIKDLQVQSIDGTIKVKGPCSMLNKLGEENRNDWEPL